MKRRRSHISASGRPNWVSDGELEGHIVTCPWHFTPFDVKTGEAQEGGVTDDPIPVYEVRVEGDEVQIRKP